MSNHYSETSSFLAIPPDKIGRAKEICMRVEAEIREDAYQLEVQAMHPDLDEDEKLEEEAEISGYCLCKWEVQDDGVWFTADESFDAEHVERIARALMEELELDGYFLCSWCYVCSKPRVNEFGGGAFILARDMPTHWINAQEDCYDHYEKFKAAQEKA